MGYIESYLVQVGRYLPNRQSADILSELRTSIEDQVIDLAGDREPTAEDQKAVLGRLGHPLQVASGFNGPRYLVGPELFPIFVETLKTVLIVVAVIQLGLLFLGYVNAGFTTSLMGLLSRTFETLLWASIVVLTVFILLEYSSDQLDWYDGWTVDSLNLRPAARLNRGDLITNLVSEGVFLLWWNDVLAFQNWLPGAGDVFTITLSSTWAPLHWPLNLLFGASFLLHAFVLVRGVWRVPTLRFEITLGVVLIAVCGWLLANGPLVNVDGAVGEHAERITHRSISTIIVGVAAVTMWDIWLAFKRLRETKHN